MLNILKSLIFLNMNYEHSLIRSIIEIVGRRFEINLSYHYRDVNAERAMWACLHPAIKKRGVDSLI